MSELTIDYQIATDSLVFVPSEDKVEAWVACALSFIEDCPSSMTVRVVERSEMVELNTQFRNKPSVTNVLSFPFESIAGVDYDHLGDIVICADVVVEEARDQHKSDSAHWAHLVVHGTLHLCGFDHEEEGEAEEMETLETSIMEKMGFDNPYATGPNATGSNTAGPNVTGPLTAAFGGQ